MLRKLVGGLAVVAALGTSMLYARQGTVITKDGKTYNGDITEKGDKIDVVGTGGTVGLNRGNVASINYPDQTATDVRAALKKLDRSDVKSRVILAREAIKGQAYEAARDSLMEAAAVDPKNPEVTQLMAEIAPHLPTTAPTTLPATNPVTVGPTTNPAHSKEIAANGIFELKRPINNAEINRIRQLEWLVAETDPGVRIQIEADAKRRFLASYVDISRDEFNRMTAGEQADLILTKGKPDLAKGVLITSDPASIAEFKRTANKAVVTGCAAANCHGGNKAGTFMLVAANNNAAIYTNFLVLQKYAATLKGSQKPLIDRDYPESSLVLQFMLGPDIADTAHPVVPNFKAPIRTKADPRYGQILHWIQSLNPVTPQYGIDLSKDPPAPETEKK